MVLSYAPPLTILNVNSYTITIPSIAYSINTATKPATLSIAKALTVLKLAAEALLAVAEAAALEPVLEPVFWAVAAAVPEAVPEAVPDAAKAATTGDPPTLLPLASS